MAKKAATAEATPQNVNVTLDRELADRKLTNLVKLADEASDMSIICVATGLPQLDYILHPHKKGIPMGRDIEFFSRKPESGKTSLAMQILRSGQSKGLRTLAVDVERTMTDELFDMLGLVTDPFYAANIPALRLMRSDNNNLAAEEFLSHVKSCSQLFDLIVLDSVAAMETRANLEKEVDDAKGVGGCSKLLSEFFRGNLTKRAGIVWINQTRQKIGMQMPGMGEGIVRPGGKALEFYASVIMELTMIKKLKAADDQPPYGMEIQVFTEKNKIAPPFRKCVLTYLFGRGFSSEYDYLDLAEKAKVVEKSGTWYSFRGERLGQGKLNTVTFLERNPAVFAAVKKAVDGEDVVAEEVVQATRQDTQAIDVDFELMSVPPAPELRPQS